jgi:hypothetical protein
MRWSVVGLIRCGLCVLPIALGCDGAANGPIATGPLSGEIGGQPWTLATGETDAFLSMGSNGYFVEAYPDLFTPCVGSAPDPNENQLVFTIPDAVGDYALSSSLNATFFVAATQDNLIATSGHLVVGQITATQITGGGHFTYDAGDTVDGQFQIQICP